MHGAFCYSTTQFDELEWQHGRWTNNRVVQRQGCGEGGFWVQAGSWRASHNQLHLPAAALDLLGYCLVSSNLGGFIPKDRRMRALAAWTENCLESRKSTHSGRCSAGMQWIQFS
ncbi:hypothetical protein VOLCADRAFT_96081 [Volvox carteri f. nagariensis]|uniref:Uncharacterized protein n=1 Tax=Volvox carteri f. nagariensis TaxID=3068 RepID=D8U958_VOLCA|nr:uncharacterized protein VOLCADRAFT_96081 [Volvox carteri f. nagariensis]EFJ43694.1 hypothetical protein VOLCADRAFT_96081 [Volvox carteri f. nagariensis]|eukprot:XP_002955175.1 hypothetical protein VOLCADRAFT_96081 [Volvox carteri f. nagariensis]